jgi:hypothetical protein
MDASLEWCSTPPLWHTKAVGGRPPHQAPRAKVRLSERPRRVALRTETIKGKLAEIGPSHSDHVGWLAPGRCRMHGGASPGAPRGEANGNYRHGHYGREAIQERRALRALIRQARKLAASVG